MGNSILEYKTRKIPEDNQSIDKAIQFIFNFQQPFTKRLEFENHLSIINNQILKKSIMTTQQEGKIYINGLLLKIWYTKKSQQLFKQIFDYWLKDHHQICRKSILTFQISGIFYLWEFVKLFLILTERKFTNILNSVRLFNLQETTKYNKDNLDQQELLIQRKNIIVALSVEYAIRIVRLLAETIHHLLQFNTNLITRSQFTLIQIRQFCENSFVILCRIYLRQENHEQIKQGAIQQWNKIIQIAGFFLGKAIEDKNPQLYELSVIVLLSLLSQPRMKKQIQSFPTHLFKNLPITDNKFHDFIFANVLLVLSDEKIIKNNDDQETIKCNRIHSLRLLQFLITNQYATFTNLTLFYLENICLNLKIDQLERIYVAKLAEQAIKFKKTEVLEKAIKTQNISYILKFKNKSFLLSPTLVQSYLKQILPTLPPQVTFYSQRYIYHKLYKKNVLPLWNQNSLWTFIIKKSKQKGDLVEKQE